jgi:hypothetical protein
MLAGLFLYFELRNQYFNHSEPQISKTSVATMSTIALAKVDESLF